MAGPYKYKGDLMPKGVEGNPEVEEEPKSLMDLLIEVVRKREESGKDKMVEAGIK